MFVDPFAYILLSWLVTKVFPGLLVFVRGNRILALLLKEIKHISSESLINYVMVLIECRTRSNRLNP